MGNKLIRRNGYVLGIVVLAVTLTTSADAAFVRTTEPAEPAQTIRRVDGSAPRVRRVTLPERMRRFIVGVLEELTVPHP